MKQDETRVRLNRYILQNGVTAKHICNLLGLHQSVLSRWRKSKADLYEEQLAMIEVFLDKKSY